MNDTLHPIANHKTSDPSGSSGSKAVASCQIGRVTSTKLLGRSRELEIVHKESIYRLRITSTGKLILTK